jgi:hypothetical protein
MPSHTATGGMRTPLRYCSVSGSSGPTVSLLSCSALDEVRSRRRTSWHLKLSTAGIYARCEAPAKTLVFDRLAFAKDPVLPLSIGNETDRESLSVSWLDAGTFQRARARPSA